MDSGDDTVLFSRSSCCGEGQQAGAGVLGWDTSADPCHGGRAVGQCPSFVCVPEERVGFAGSGWGRLPHLSPPRPSRRAAPEQPCSGPHAGRHHRAKLLHRSGVPAGSLCPLEGIQLQSPVPGPPCSCRSCSDVPGSFLARVPSVFFMASSVLLLAKAPRKCHMSQACPGAPLNLPGLSLVTLLTLCWVGSLFNDTAM